jgi:hypothetical protein
VIHLLCASVDVELGVALPTSSVGTVAT